MTYKEKIIQDIVEFEMQNTPDDILQKKYGIDLSKWYSEGSTWVVYNYDKMAEYYQRNKRRINKQAKYILHREADTI